MKYRFGEKIRAVRERRGRTLKSVASEVGISESMLSQIERNKVSPAVDTLLGIADVLAVDLEYLFSELRQERSVVIVRSGEASQTRVNGALYEHLAVTKDEGIPGMESYILTLVPGAKVGSSDYGHPGRELGYVLSGQGMLRIGSREESLFQGDSLSFASDIPHELINNGEHPFKLLWCLTPPKKERRK